MRSPTDSSRPNDKVRYTGWLDPSVRGERMASGEELAQDGEIGIVIEVVGADADPRGEFNEIGERYQRRHDRHRRIQSVIGSRDGTGFSTAPIAGGAPVDGVDDPACPQPATCRLIRGVSYLAARRATAHSGSCRM